MKGCLSPNQIYLVAIVQSGIPTEPSREILECIEHIETCAFCALKVRTKEGELAARTQKPQQGGKV